MKNYSEEKLKNILYLLPIVCIVAIIPVVVRFKIILLEGELFKYWTGEYVNYDYFAYFKGILIVTFTLIALILFLLRILKDGFNLKKNILYLPMTVYSISIVLSVFFSDYKLIATLGYVQRFEGALVIISYILIQLITVNSINEDYEIKIIIYGLIVSALLVAIIGISQYLRYDLYRSFIGGRIIYPRQLNVLADNRNFEGIQSVIYATFGNSNYVGSYMSMIFPISFGLYFFQRSQKKVLLFGGITLIFYTMWIGCKSRAGILGGLVAITVFLLIYRKELFKNSKKLLIIVPFIIIFLLMDRFSSGSLINKINTLNPIVEKELAELRNIDLEDIVINKNNASIIGKEYILNMSFINDQIVFTDEFGKDLGLKTNNNGMMMFNDERYSNFAVRYKIFPSKTLLEMRLNSRPLNWYYENGELSIIGKLGTFYTELNKPESFGFEGRERFASSRGYIWSRSIPLLKDALLIGYGPDTFAAVFPQDDLVGKIKYLSRTDILVDKPHNFYLQTFLNTGGLSLISLLAIFIVYIWTGFKLFWNSDIDAYHKQIGVVILIAIIGYLVAAFFNDSVVSVAPVFWTLLGIGYSINDRVKKENKIQATIEDSELNE